MQHASARREPATADITMKKRFALFSLLVAALCVIALAAGCGGGGGGESISGSPFTQPDGLTIIETSTNTYTITWNTVVGASHYELSKSNGASVTVIIATASTYIDRNIVEGTEYNFFLRACSGTTCSWQSLSSTKLTIPDQFTAAGNPSAAKPTILLSWKGVQSAEYYKIYRGCESATATILTTYTPEFSKDVYYSDTDLSPSTDYDYCISACKDSVCTAKSDPKVTGTTGLSYNVPAEPSLNSATANGQFKIQAEFTPVASATYYYLYYYNGTVGESKVMVSSSPYTLSNLSANTKYKLSLSACNYAGCSSRSGEITVTTATKDVFTLASDSKAVSLANAIPISPTPGDGNYVVSFSKGALKSSTAADYFGYAMLYSLSPPPTVESGPEINLTPIEVSKTLTLYGTDTYAIFVDSSGTGDNSGVSVLNFSMSGQPSENFNLAGFGNSVQVSSSNATSISLPAGNYNVKVTGTIKSNSNKIKHMLLLYTDTATGTSVLKILQIDISAGEGTATISSSSSAMYAFILDKTTSDNEGTLTLEFSKQ